MITLTKEWLLKTIAELEEERDATPGAVNEDAAMALAAMKLALASLEAEHAGFIVKHKVTGKFGSWLHSKADWFRSDEYEVLSAYTAPPAPVSVPEEVLKSLLPDVEKSEFWFEHNGKILFEGVKFNNAVFEACRAAMLQGADRPQNEPQNIPENIPATQFKPVADLYGLTSPTGGETSFTFDAVEARDFIDGGWSCQEYVELERFQDAMSSNSPVIPDGWVAVPVEPTEHMIVEGFESEPDEFFSDAELWEAYNAMTGCQQAAHRAKLCWAAMIEAAPKLE